MSQAIGAYDAMSLITYTPRADSNDRGYEQWLIDVDQCPILHFDLADLTTNFRSNKLSFSIRSCDGY